MSEVKMWGIFHPKVIAEVAATSSHKARVYAKEQDTYDIDWTDPDIEVKEIASFAKELPPDGDVSYRVVDAIKDRKL